MGILLGDLPGVSEVFLEAGPGFAGWVLADDLIPFSAGKVEVARLTEMTEGHVDEVRVCDVLTSLLGVALVVLKPFEVDGGCFF